MKTDACFIVMGVSGSGKTTITQKLAAATAGDWLDADDFHTAETKAKMHAGTPLTDEDRWPWLDRLNTELRARTGKGKPLFLACSALKQKYRDRLVAGVSEARIVYLKGSFTLIHDRLAQRRNHFMPAALLESQFAALEEPQDAIILNISRTEDQLVGDFKFAIAASGAE
jgi:gluconokinase